MNIRAAVLILILAVCTTGASAQMPGADYTPTEAQVQQMMNMNTTMVMLIAQAAGNFEGEKGDRIAEKNGFDYYHVAHANDAMKPAIEMIAIQNAKAYYTAVYNEKKDAQFALAAFMMMLHFGKNDGSFTIEEDKTATGKDKSWYLLLKGTKVGFYKYYGGDNTGVLSIGMF